MTDTFAVLDHHQRSFNDGEPVKTECLDRLILFGQDHLERVLREYVEHYHRARPHQGIGNELVHGTPRNGTGDVVEHERLGGLLRQRMSV